MGERIFQENLKKPNPRREEISVEINRGDEIECDEMLGDEADEENQWSRRD